MKKITFQSLFAAGIAVFCMLMVSFLLNTNKPFLLLIVPAICILCFLISAFLLDRLNH